MFNHKEPKLLSDEEMQLFTFNFASRFNYSMQARALCPELPMTNVFITRLFGRLNN